VTLCPSLELLAGKSTLLSVLTSAKPKIANYPFTTLVPNLGVCEMDYRTTVFADVPGLIEGAHTGEGLGHEFLRHVSRARALVHVIDGTSADALYDYRAIRLELELFGMDLTEKQEVVAYNKVDLPESGDYFDDMKELLAQECGVSPDVVFPVSAVTGQGVLDLVRFPLCGGSLLEQRPARPVVCIVQLDRSAFNASWQSHPWRPDGTRLIFRWLQVRAVRKMLDEMPEEVNALETAARNQQVKIKSTTDHARLDDFTIESELAEHRTWFVRGVALERFAQMTNWDYFESSLRFQRVLQTIGLWTALERQGVVPGDSVVIGEAEFTWSSDRSDGNLYESWLNGLKARGKVGKGSSSWPHMTG
jgi:GTPase